jgi:predicted helicase
VQYKTPSSASSRHLLPKGEGLSGNYSIIYNDFLTLDGIPENVFGYKLGNRSALDWIIDQYQVTTDKRSGITNDPNRDDEPDYIVKLIKKIVTVSIETVTIVVNLEKLDYK